MFGCGWNVYILVQKYLGKTGIWIYHWLPLGEYPGYQSDQYRSLTGTLSTLASRRIREILRSARGTLAEHKNEGI